MSAPVTAATEKPWPADVLEFASTHNLRPYLNPLMEATERVLPTAHRIRITLEQDPEIADDRHIVFHADVPAADVPDFVGAVHRWNEALYTCCPAEVSCSFGLSLQLIPS
jgi:hypothetical protein